MVFQHFMLADNLTVLENVVLGAERLHGIGGDARAEVKRISDCLRPRDRARPPGRGARRRRPPAGGDPEGALPRREHRDPRRAHRRAGAAGGRRAVRQPARAEEGGHLGHLHQPQARRGPLRRRRDHRDPARHHGADRAADRGDRPSAGRADGGLRAALAQHRDLHRHRRGAAVGQAPRPARARGAARCSTTSPSTSTRARCSASPVSRATARPSSSSRSWRMRPGVDRHRRARPARTSPAESTRERRESGVGYIPEDRHRHGLLLDAPLWENRVLGHQSRPPSARGPLIDKGGARTDTERIIKEYDVRTPGPDVLARALSGGNQQKLIVGREMSGEPDPADRGAPDPRRRRRRPGRDLGTHQGGPPQRARGAPDLGRPRRADRPLRPDRGHPPRPAGRHLRPRRRDTRAARLGDDRSRSNDPARDQAASSRLSAPLLALVAAFVITSLVLAAAERPGASTCGTRSCRCPRDATWPTSSTTPRVLYLSGLAAAIGFRMNLFNIGVDGQYRVAAFTAAVVAGEAWLPGYLNTVLAILCAMAVGALWAGIAGVLRATRGVSEVISTIMLNAIATGLVAYLLRKAAVTRRGQQRHRHQGDPGEQPDPQHLHRRRSGPGGLRLRDHRRAGRVPLLVRPEQDPVRLRPPRHRPLDHRGDGQRHQDHQDGRLRDADLGRRGRPGRAPDPVRRELQLRLDVPVRAGLRRHRDRAARPQPPHRGGGRRAAVRLSSTSSPTRSRSWSGSRPTSWRSPRAPSCSPS